jgi:AraC-like DNA-binding protein
MKMNSIGIPAKICANPAMAGSRLQREFFQTMADPAVFRELFDHLPEIFFFVKDRDSRLIAGSSHLLARLGVKLESDLVGTRDEDFFPAHIARGFREDDQRVFRTGRPVKNRLEVWYDEQHNLDWFLTTKLPLHGRNGKIIGLMGITRRAEIHRMQRPESRVVQVVNCVQRQSSANLSTAELARECGMSVRTLHRRVKESLGVTPHQFILRFRVQKAAETLIQTEAKIGEIALAHGFCDQSAFTRHFHRRTGATPTQFRRRHRG